MSNDRYSAMLTAVQRFHDKHGFRESGGEDLPYRVALMAEELTAAGQAMFSDLCELLYGESAT